MAQDIKVALTLDNKQFNKGLAQSEKKTKQFAKESKSGISGLTKAFAGLFAVIGVGELIKFGDEFTNINNRLKAVTGSTDEAAKAFKLVSQVASDSRASLAATASLYSDLIIATKDLGTSQAEIADITRVFGQTLAISGADAGAAAGAIRQFGQALASGVLRGDEFNSIAETNSAFMLKLAESLGKPIGALRDLAKEGALTADVILQATRNMKNSVQADFDLTAVTVSQAFVALRNSVVQLFGNIEAETGVMDTLSSAISDLAKAINEIDTDGLSDALSTLGTILVVVTGAITILSAGLVNSANLFVALESAIALGIGRLSIFGVAAAGAATNLGTLRLALQAVAAAFGLLFASIKAGGFIAALGTLGTALIALTAAAAPVIAVIAGIGLVIEGVGRLIAPGKSPFVRMFEQIKELLGITEEEAGVVDDINALVKEQAAARKILADKLKAEADEKKKNIKLDKTYADFIEELNKKIKTNVRDEGFRVKAIEEIRQKYIATTITLEEYIQAMKILSNSLIDVDERLKGARDAVTDFNDEIRDSTNDLQQAFDELSMGTLEIELADIKRDLEQLRDETLAELQDELADLDPQIDANAIATIKAQMDQVTEATKEAILAQQDLATETYNASRTFETGWNQALTQFIEDSTNEAAKAKEVFDTFTKGVEDAFVNFAKTGKLSFKDLLDSMVEMLIRSQVQKLMGSLLGAMPTGGGGGGIGGFFKSIFGLAKGGPAQGGRPYIVGEEGPELFVPKSSGTVVPNGQSMGGSTVNNVTNITNSVSAVDAKSVAQLFAENRKTLLGTVQMAQNEMPYG